MTEETKTEEEEFEDYFKEAMDEEEGIVAEEEQEEIEVVEDEEVVVTTTEEEETTTDEEEIVEEPTLDVDEQLALIQAENEKLAHKMASWDGRIRKANERASVAEEELAIFKAHKETEDSHKSPSDDDAILKEFKDEFPDLVKPIRAYAKMYAQEIADERLGEVAPKIEQIQHEQQISAREQFAAPIVEAHSDWETIHESGKLQEWIDTQSSLQQRVLNEVVKNGSQLEIIDMFDAYKKANNIPQTKTKTSGEVDSVESIVAVPARSAGPPAEKADMSDFESAWKEANLPE